MSKPIAKIGQTEIRYAVNGSKTLSGLLGLIAYLLIQWSQKLPADPIVLSAFGSLAGIGATHKLWKAGRSPAPE